MLGVPDGPTADESNSFFSIAIMFTWWITLAYPLFAFYMCVGYISSFLYAFFPLHFIVIGAPELDSTTLISYLWESLSFPGFSLAAMPVATESQADERSHSDTIFSRRVSSRARRGGIRSYLSHLVFGLLIAILLRLGYSCDITGSLAHAPEFYPDWAGCDYSSLSLNRSVGYVCFHITDNMSDGIALGGTTSVSPADPVAYLDSGAVHCYLQPHYAEYVYAFREPDDIYISTAGSQKLKCTHVGRIGKLPQALIVEGLTNNLISCSALQRDLHFTGILLGETCYGVLEDGKHCNEIFLL